MGSTGCGAQTRLEGEEDPPGATRGRAPRRQTDPGVFSEHPRGTPFRGHHPGLAGHTHPDNQHSHCCHPRLSRAGQGPGPVPGPSPAPGGLACTGGGGGRGPSGAWGSGGFPQTSKAPLQDPFPPHSWGAVLVMGQSSCQAQTSATRATRLCPSANKAAHELRFSLQHLLTATPRRPRRQLRTRRACAVPCGLPTARGRLPRGHRPQGPSTEGLRQCGQGARGCGRSGWPRPRLPPTKQHSGALVNAPRAGSHGPANRKVAGSTASQGAHLGFGPGPGGGRASLPPSRPV